MTSIPDPDEKIIYYDPRTTADLLAAIDYAMQPLRDTTSREVQEAQSIRDLHTLAYCVTESGGKQTMTLYEIDQRIADAIELDVDTETGEIMTTEALDQLKADRDAKIEGIALYIKNLSAEAEAIKAEKLKLAARQAVCEHKAQRLTRYLDDSLQGQKLKTPRVAISYRDTRGGRLVVDDAALVPAEWRKPGEPDKAAIRDLLRQGGSVPGCRLEDAHSIIIR